MPESDINTIRYLLDGIRNILERNNANLVSVPGGFKISTGKPGPHTVTPTIVMEE